tara:strand:+ start:891 stop:1079 length:189 start_codon:yes stop_codon:yes gene_type:complete
MIEQFFKFRPFRSWVVQQYYANRDEYDSAGQTQPYTFEQYWHNYAKLLQQQYREQQQWKIRG